MKLSGFRSLLGLILKESMAAALLLIGVSLIVFTALYTAPGNPFRQASATSGPPPHAPAAWHTHYLDWGQGVLTGDFGYSLRTGRPVLAEVIPAGVKTLVLSGGSMTLALLLAVPLAIVSARAGDAAIGWLLLLPGYLLSAAPAFWFGYVVIYIAIHHFGFFPLAISGHNRTHSFLFYFFPIIVLGLCGGILGEMLRHLREELIRVMGEDYIRAARAKGANVWRHAFKEGLFIPITEIIAAKIPFILGGAVVVEQVFNWPGMGAMAWRAAQDRDYPIIMAITLIAALIVRIGFLLKKIAHASVLPQGR